MFLKLDIKDNLKFGKHAKGVKSIKKMYSS